MHERMNAVNSECSGSENRQFRRGRRRLLSTKNAAHNAFEFFGIAVA
jgi:hypothetical protein